MRESRAEREALTEEVASRDKENLGLGSRLAEAQDGVAQLKQLVENHQCSEREKNKRVGGWAGGRAGAASRTHPGPLLWCLAGVGTVVVVPADPLVQ